MLHGRTKRGSAQPMHPQTKTARGSWKCLPSLDPVDLDGHLSAVLLLLVPVGGRRARKMLAACGKFRTQKALLNLSGVQTRRIQAYQGVCSRRQARAPCLLPTLNWMMGFSHLRSARAC
jgi:hypothetical protein